MKTVLNNKTHIEGILYEHDLELRTSGPNSKNPGTPFITGTISLATDNAITNIVPIHYTYVTATTSKGSVNSTFTLLKNIIDGIYTTYMENGDKAPRLRVDSAIGLNDFYTERNGKTELVSAKRNEGGFIHLCDNNALIEDEKKRDTFECDMIITNCIRIDANEEKNLPEKVVVKGAIFDFKKALLPIEFTAVNSKAMDYFEGLGASSMEPVFTKVWGRQISETVVSTTTEESAFGEALVKESRSTRRDWVITGALSKPYVWDDQSTITVKELEKAMSDRETYLATVKQRYEEYKNSKGQSPSTTENVIIPSGGFDF